MESPLTRSKKGNVKYVESYDFKQPKLFSKEIMRTLRAIHDVLSRNLSRIFSTSLRYKVDVFLSDIVQLSSNDFVQNIENPSTIYILSVDELNGEIIVVLPPEFCIHLIERQSGGQARELTERRTLTVIEEKIINRIIHNVNDEIVTAWEPYMDFHINKTTYESKSENLHLTSVDPTIIVKFVVDLEGDQVEVGVSYSYSLLKKAMSDTILKKGIKSKLERLSAEELKAYKNTLRNAEVVVQPLLGTTELTLKDIINLKEGDTIPLKQKAEQPLQVRINGKSKMTAYPGVIKGRRAIKVYELIEEINEMELV